MGRLEHAIDSLRLLCTRNSRRAKELANVLQKTNRKRQKIVDEVVLHAREVVEKGKWSNAIVVSHKSYHEGVIGLAASKLVEEFGKPAIVLSVGKNISKASARSIPGFDIIESIKKLDELILGGGGHPMAAGFSIETNKIGDFKKKFEELSSNLITVEVLNKKIRIDTEIGFESINTKLMSEIAKFEPFGISNFAPVFITRKVKVVDARTVGVDSKHLKLILEKNGLTFNTIAFGKGDCYKKILSVPSVDVVYNLIRDMWNGNDALQLKIKDIKLR
jgi:single-stranded-DNA-specific exonuclease